MILHSKYTDGRNTVELHDIYENKCFVFLNEKLVAMNLDNFLARFKLIY